MKVSGSTISGYPSIAHCAASEMAGGLQGFFALMASSFSERGDLGVLVIEFRGVGWRTVGVEGGRCCTFYCTEGILVRRLGRL